MQRREADFFVQKGNNATSFNKPKDVSLEPMLDGSSDSNAVASVHALDQLKTNPVPYDIHSPRFLPPRTSSLPRYMIGEAEFFKVGKLYVATRDLWPIGIKRVKGVSIINGRAYFDINSAVNVSLEHGLMVPTVGQWKYIIRQIYQGGSPDPTGWDWELESNLQFQLDLDFAGSAMGSFGEYVVQNGERDVLRGAYPCKHAKPFPFNLLHSFISGTNLDVVEIDSEGKHRGPGYGLTSKRYTYRCIASSSLLYIAKPTPI